jgi:zinc resistance-associated protein
MKKTIIAGVTALALLAPSLSYAQQQPTQQGAADHERGHPSQADLNAFTDARVAALKAGLQLTPDQLQKWAPVEQAIRAMAQARQQRWQRVRNEARSEDAIARLRARADAMTQRAADLRKLADAAEPLYQSLTEEQKHRLRFLAPMVMGHRHFAGGRHHHREGRRG